ncbi:MAG: ribosome silencing factor [Actinomycetia bacterium]|nr:ribosome silencing factor [Actinomycetes bacterium]
MKDIKLAKFIAKKAAEKKAEDIVILHIGEYLNITSYFVICSGNNKKQVKAISDDIQEKLAKKKIKSFSREGETEAEWILLDYGDVIIHVFDDEVRKYYNLERLWKNVPHINIEGI